MARAGTSPDARREVCVLVAVEHAVVGESVRAALSERGYVPVVVRVGNRQPSVRPEVGVLLTHSFDYKSLRARAYLEPTTVPWLVLAPEERGPTWGAYYSSGATLVLPPSASLDDVCGHLQDLAMGREPSVSRGRRELIDAWHQTLRERDELESRLSSLTVRELQVLLELRDGVSVRYIAQGSEVAEATVRAQVRAILRKLDVSSQMAAVAAYTRVQRDPATRRNPAPSWPSRSPSPAHDRHW